VIERERAQAGKLAKHGNEITKKALDRYDRNRKAICGPCGPDLRMFPEYSLAFGYEVPAAKFRIRANDFCVGPDPASIRSSQGNRGWNWRGLTAGTGFRPPRARMIVRSI